jgi:hypothetical protein
MINIVIHNMYCKIQYKVFVLQKALQKLGW